MREELDERILEKGKLWKEFRGTLWGLDLYAFFEDQEKSHKELLVDYTLEGNSEKAQLMANKINGILVVKEYIEDSIRAMEDLVSYEQESKDHKRSIPSHV